MRVAALQSSDMAKWFGHHGASLVVGLTALTLAGLPIFSGANRGMPDFCHVFNRIYLNGEIFTAPGDTRCVQQICINGSVDFHQEACLDSDTGECHLVGSYYLRDCDTYTCMRRYFNGDIDYYQNLIAHGCRDYYGACHHVGSEFFYQLEGQLRLCLCALYDNSTVMHSC